MHATPWVRITQFVGEKHPLGVVLYGGDELLPFGDGMVALPMRTLWAWRVK